MIVIFFVDEEFRPHNNGETKCSSSLCRNGKWNILPVNETASLDFPTKLLKLSDPIMGVFSDESRSLIVGNVSLG